MDETVKAILNASPSLASAALLGWVVFKMLDRFERIAENSSKVIEAMAKQMQASSDARQDKYEAALTNNTRAMTEMTEVVRSLRDNHR